MPISQHNVEHVDGSAPLRTDRLIIGVQANVSVTTPGTNAATAVSFAAESLPVDASGNALYGVLVTPNQNAVPIVSAKTANGFTVTLEGTTSAGAKFDVFVFA